MNLFHKTDFSRAFALALPVWILEHPATELNQT